MPGVVKLGGDPDLLTGDTRVLDTETNLSLVAVGESSVDVTVTSEESGLDGFADLVGLGLPSTETNSWDFGTLWFLSAGAIDGVVEQITNSVEGEGLLCPVVRHDGCDCSGGI